MNIILEDQTKVWIESTDQGKLFIELELPHKLKKGEILITEEQENFDYTATIDFFGKVYSRVSEEENEERWEKAKKMHAENGVGIVANHNTFKNLEFQRAYLTVLRKRKR